MSATEVRAALEAGEGPKALHASLAVWRDTRHPTVGAVVRALDAQLAFEGPSIRSRERFHLAWMGLAEDPPVESLGWLARNVAEKLPQPDGPIDYSDAGLIRRMAPFQERIARLAAHLDDPRVADGVVLALGTGAGGAGAMYWYEVSSVFEPAMDLVRRCADAHTVSLCEELLERPRARKRGAREWLSQTLPEVTAARTHAPPDLKEWTALLPRAAEEDASAVQLLEQIREAPGDRALRAVYADVLQEVGDPRGTFVALQLEETPVAEKKAGALFRSHGSEWLGPELSRVLVNVTFRDGFLYRASLAPNAAASDDGWTRAKADPRLRTLVRLSKGRGNRRHYGDFLTSSACTALADVELPFSRLLTQLLDCPHPRNIRVVRSNRLPARKVLLQMADSPHFSSLQTVVLGGPGTRDADRFLRSNVRSLRSAGLPVTRLGIEAALVKSAPKGVLGATDGLGDLGLERLELGWERAHVTVVRNDDASVDVWSFGEGLRTVGRVVSMLGPTVRRVVVHESRWAVREATVDARQVVAELRDAHADRVETIELIEADALTPRLGSSDASGLVDG